MKKYYAYGTYSENGNLYTSNGKLIEDKDAYYEACRANKTESPRRGTYTSKGITYEVETNSYKKPRKFYK